jgi:glutamate/tyrosine decarboxylase-like PLP-dependent enzyme
MHFLAELEALEAEARKLEAPPEERRAMTRDAGAYASAFISALPDNKTYSPDTAQAAEALFSLPIQEGPRDLESLLGAMDAGIHSTGINPASGGHFGYVPGGGLFHAALGDYLAAATNRYAGIFFANPGAVRIENILIRWMCRMVGYPESALGNLASGGSIANLIAITTAREHHGIKAAEIPNNVIYLTGQVHHCVQKALRIAGMGEAVLRYIPMDERYRMDTRALQTAITADRAAGLRPFMVTASAGTTDTGAIDPLDVIADIALDEGLWYHIDAAYGGFFMLAGELRPKFKGIERSDSIAIDPHKGLFLPYGLGAVLIRNLEAQFNAHFYTANYLQDALDTDAEPSPADLSPELTKHFRGLRMWLPLQLIGLAPFRAAIREKVLLCNYAYARLRAIGFETGPPPELSIAIFRYVPPKPEDPDTFNERLVRYVQDDGRVFLSSTRIGGNYWIRLAVLSFRSHRKEVDLCLSVLEHGLGYLLATPTSE